MEFNVAAEEWLQDPQPANGDCGREFEAYIREVECKNKTLLSAGSLWQERKLRILLTRDSPVWHVGKVKKLEQQKQEEWFLTMEFETCGKKKKKKKERIDDNEDDDDLLQLRLGDYVELRGLVSASQYNGSYGVVISDENFKETGRYGIQVRNTERQRETKVLSIRPENLSKFITLEDDEEKENVKKEWTWKINRVHPVTGGTLEGTTRDCADLLSFEWLEDPQPAHMSPSSSAIEMNRDFWIFQDLNEISQWTGTSGYFPTFTNQRLRLNKKNPSAPYQVFNFITCSKVPWSFKHCPIKSLPRSKVLPPPSAKRRPEPEKPGEMNWAFRAYNHMAIEGKFTAEWFEEDDPHDILVNFYIDSTGPGEPPLRKPTALAFYYRTQIAKDLSGGTVFKISEDSLSSALNSSQETYFCARLTHCFLRQQNVLRRLSTSKVRYILHDFFEFFLKKKALKDALDIAVMLVDWTYSTYNRIEHESRDETFNSPSFCCNKAAEVLEAMGRFGDAAKLYSDTADHFTKDADIHHLYLNAGLAYTRINDFENAERQQLKSLYHSRDLEMSKQGVAFSNMLMNYAGFFRNSTQQHIKNMWPTLSAVLFFAVYEDIKHDLSEPSLFYVETFGHSQPSVLRNKFMNRSVAKKVLKKAINSAENVEEFRKCILACAHPRVSEIDMGGCSRSRDGPIERDLRSDCRNSVKEKQNAKEYLLDTNMSLDLNRCSNCSAVDDKHKFSKCPCKHVRYCSKNCQVEHWKKTHKKVCTAKKKKKKDAS